MEIKSPPFVSLLLLATASLAGCATVSSRVGDGKDSSTPVLSEAAPEHGAVPAPRRRVEPKSVSVISRVAMRPKEIVPSQQESVLSFETAVPGELEVRLRDEADRLVRVLRLGPQPAGRIAASWDGLDSAGLPVPSGVYLFEIRLRTEEGVELTYGEEAIGGGEEIIGQRFQIDSQSGTISYVLPRAGRVRLLVGLRGLPYLVALHTWTPQRAGRHQLHWDGYDAARLLQLTKHPKLRAQLDAYEIPTNSIIVVGQGGSESRRPPGSRPFAQGYRHAVHDPLACHSPHLEVTFPDAVGETEQGTPILAGPSILRVTVDPADVADVISARFELMFFVDTTFIFENEEGTSPFNYELPVESFRAGRHLLTVNLLSSDDHIGIATFPFVVQKGSGKP